MSISERASAGIRQLPEREQPVSEQFRVIAKQWVELDGAARFLEDTASAVKSQMMKRLGDVPAAHAKRDVEASPEWLDHIRKTVSARTAANTKKVHMEFLRMRFSEWQSAEANSRAERRL